MNTYCVNQFNICIMKMYKTYSLIVEENSIDNLDKQGLYLITNILNGKVYVGQARVNFAARYYAHNYGLTNNVHHNRHLQRAWNKYGKDAFVFSIFKILPADIDILNKEEDYWVEYYRAKFGIHNVYNIAGGGNSPHYTQEFCDNDSQKMLEKWKDPVYRAKRTASLQATLRTPEYRKRRSEIATQLMKNNDLRKQISNTMIDLWKDEEYRKMQMESRTFYDDPNWHTNVSKGVRKKFDTDPEFKMRNAKNSLEGRKKTFAAWKDNIDYVLIKFILVYPEVLGMSVRRKRKLVRLCISYIKKDPSCGKMDLETMNIIYDDFLNKYPTSTIREVVKDQPREAVLNQLLNQLHLRYHKQNM